MEDKVNEILERTKIIQSSFMPKKTILSHIFVIIEKLLLPAAIVILGFCANRASLNLTNAQEKRQQREAQENVQLKYIELFYQDVSSDNPERQNAAISLITLMRPEFGEQIASWVQANHSLPKQVRKRAEQISDNYARFGILNTYKIGIYFLKGDNNLSSQATDLRDSLLAHGFTGQVQIYPESQNFFDRVIPPSGNEIRYEPDYEKEAADILYRILGELYPGQSYITKLVRRRTSNFISIFLGAQK